MTSAPVLSFGSLYFIQMCLFPVFIVLSLAACLCAAAERRAPEDGAGACPGAGGLSRGCHQRLPQPAGLGHPEQ